MDWLGNFKYMGITKKTLLTGTALGVTAIILGAFCAHGLKAILSDTSLSSFKTGVNYQMYHALFLLIFGLIQVKFGNRLARAVYYTCTIGIFLFSGSIYFMTLNSYFHFTEVPLGIALLTPIGGVLLVTSWILLGFYVVKNLK
jgi:uncharacterized membrane protein YgdD (TMEM256/DUF423 family)